MTLKSLWMMTLIAFVIISCSKTKEAVHKTNCPKIKLDTVSFDNFETKLINKQWRYQFTINSDSCFSVEADANFPVRYVFRRCLADSLPDLLKKTGTLRMFSGICYKAYSDSTQYKDLFKDPTLIDDNFVFIVDVKNQTEIHVVNYGVYDKGDFFIEKLNLDTLVVRSNRRYFKKSGEEMIDVRHIYTTKSL